MAKKSIMGINTTKVSYNGKSASAAYPRIYASGRNKPIQSINNMTTRAVNQKIAKQMKGTPYGNYGKTSAKGGFKQAAR